MTNFDINKAYVGTSQVEKIYLGTDVVWPTTPVYSAMPLTFEILSAGTVVWKNNGDAGNKTIQYKTNDGEWTDITSSPQGSVINVEAGDLVQFRGDNKTYGYGNLNAFSASTCFFTAKGNIMSLIDSSGFSTATTLESGYTFYHLFWGCGIRLVDASNLVLPATILSPSCYEGMFAICDGIKTPPKLPATTLANRCYAFMFANCTFTTPPELPATVMANSCYFSMFSGNQDLKETPEFPATQLASACYQGMFNVCRNLETVYTLPAITLSPNAYAEMFKSCRKINQITCLATDISASNCTTNWLYDVSPTGTFVKHPNATWPTGNNGIPTGWTVEDANI